MGGHSQVQGNQIVDRAETGEKGNGAHQNKAYKYNYVYQDKLRYGIAAPGKRVANIVENTGHRSIKVLTVPFPNLYQDIRKKHPSEVRKMGHIIAGVTCQPGIQFVGAVKKHKILRFYGEREK